MVVTAVLALSGCKTVGFLKQVESGAYEAASKGVSEYCERTGGDYVDGKRIEARRELRLLGTHGPRGPHTTPSPVDEQTAKASGPVVRIWCEGEEVPGVIWKDLKK